MNAVSVTLPRHARGTLSYDAESILIDATWRLARRLFVESGKSALVLWPELGLEGRLEWFDTAAMRMGLSR